MIIEKDQKRASKIRCPGSTRMSKYSTTIIHVLNCVTLFKLVCVGIGRTGNGPVQEKIKVGKKKEASLIIKNECIIEEEHGEKVKGVLVGCLALLQHQIDNSPDEYFTLNRAPNAIR